MKRIDAITAHPLYIRKMEEIREAEKDRIYCGHDTEHALDVARLMYIRVLEDRIKDPDLFPDIGKDIIYAAALLHDTGRADQYRDGTPHDLAGAETAKIILKDCGFDGKETALICCAILRHRQDASGEYFASLLRDSDKGSRLCFKCGASDSCKWPDEKKNMEIDE